jgi:hypothetical protein
MQLKKDVDLRSSARTALLVGWSLLAWAGEAFLLFNLHSARGTLRDLPASLYVLPIIHLLPWLAAMKWLWNTRHAVRNGYLDQAGASRCYGMVEDALSTAYVALVVVETTLGPSWRF